MCEAITIATFLLSAASAGAQYQAQQQQARGQKRLNKAATAAAERKFEADTAAAARRSSEERDAASQRQEQNQIAAAQRRSRLRTSASAAGISGLSVDSLLGDLTRQELRNADAIAANLESAEANLLDSRRSAAEQRNAGILSLPDPQGGSPVGLAIGLGQAGLTGWSMHEKSKEP